MLLLIFLLAIITVLIILHIIIVIVVVIFTLATLFLLVILIPLLVLPNKKLGCQGQKKYTEEAKELSEKTLSQNSLSERDWLHGGRALP